MKYILNFGAGVNSTALVFEIVKRKLPLDYVIFSDTHEEFEATYGHIEKMKEWFKLKQIPFIIVESKYKIGLFQYYADKKTIPFRKFRDCTDKFKKQPILKFIKQFKEEKVIQHIGIGYEELTRMKTSNKKWIIYKYPLVEWKFKRKDCERIIKKNGFEIPVKSGCYMCPFQSDKKWITLLKNNPNLFKKANEMEKNNRSYPKNTLRWSGTLQQLENGIKTQTTLNLEEEFCGGFCFT